MAVFVAEVLDTPGVDGPGQVVVDLLRRLLDLRHDAGGTKVKGLARILPLKPSLDPDPDLLVSHEPHFLGDDLLLDRTREALLPQPPDL